MKPLFTIQASNAHQSLLVRDSSEWDAIGAAINRRTMADLTRSTLFDFQQVSNQATSVPDICTVYISGALAFRAELKEQIFPQSSPSLEFLPIVASGEPWLLLNCLQAAEYVDSQGSEVMRSLNGEICFVMKIRVSDPQARAWEVFTLEKSNRAQLFVSEEFRARVERLKLKGISFQAIGEVV